MLNVLIKTKRKSTDKKKHALTIHKSAPLPNHTQLPMSFLKGAHVTDELHIKACCHFSYRPLFVFGSQWIPKPKNSRSPLRIYESL